MKFKEKMFELAVEFQDAPLQGGIVALGYFLISYICKVPVISAFGVVQSKMFQNSKSHFLFQSSSEENTSKLNWSETVLICYAIYLMTLVWIAYRKKNQMQLKIFSFGLLLIQSLNNFFSYYLIEMCIGKETVAIKVLSGIMLVAGQLPTFIIEKLLVSYEGSKSNVFSRKSNNFVILLNVIERSAFYIMVVLIFMEKDQAFLRNIYFSTLTLIYALQTYVFLFNKYFINEFCHLLQTTGSFLCLILLVIINVYEVYEEPLLKQNFYALLFIMGILSFVSIHSFIKFKNHQLLFMPNDQITSSQLILPSLTAFYLLWKNQNSAINSYFISTFRKNHKISCKDASCLCKKQLQTQDSNSFFLESYLKKCFKLLFSYTKDPKVILHILFLRLEMFHEIFQVNQKLKEIKQLWNLNDISTQVRIHILGKKLQALIKIRNSTSVSIDLQSVLNLQDKIDNMERIIIDDIRIKKHKWKYLCQSICKSTDIQEDIVKQISNIIAFEQLFHANKLNYKKNLAFNCLSLFYYGSIVFLKKEIHQIEDNIRQIVTPNRECFINSEKQLQKNIFNHNCCLLEFDIHHRNENGQDFQLKITNCSKNSMNVFGRKKCKMVGSNITAIFPQFLWNDMKQILQSFFESKSFNNKVQNCYYVDSHGHVFQGLSCIKILAKNDIIELIFIVLKKDADKLVLANQRGLIENVGNEYIKNFGLGYQGLPFSCLFYTPEDFHQIISSKETEGQRKVDLINGKQIQQGRSVYLQNVIKYSEKDDFKCIGTSSHQIGANKNLLKKYYDFLTNQRRELLNAKKKTVSLVSINVDRQHKPSRVNFSLIDAIIRYKKCKMNNLPFYKIVLDRIQNKLNYQYDAIQSTKGRIKLGEGRSNPQKINNPFNVEQSSCFSKNQQEDEKDSSEDSIQEDSDFNSNQNVQNDERIINSNSEFIVEKNSIHSSLKTDDMVNFNNRFIEICFKLFKNPNEIRDKRLKIFTGNSLICSILFAGLLSASFVIFRLSLQQVKDIFFADGAVSDNMQMTQFMYNRALNFKLHQDNKTFIEIIENSADFQRQYLYGLMVQDLHKFISIVTSMTKTRFYEYIKVTVKWKTPNSNLKEVQIQSNQFLIFYKRLSMKVHEGVKNGTVEALIDAEKSLQTMKANFPQLKRINHYNLYLYKKLSDESLSLTESLFWFLSLTHVMLSVAVFCIFYREKMFRRMQQIEGYSIYKIIPPKVIDILSNYYGRHAEENKTDADLAKYEHYFENYGLVLGADGKVPLKPNKSLFMTSNKSPLAAYKMLFILLIINLFYAIFIFRIKGLVQPIKSMMNNVNDLMDSQNYLLEAYFDLKANFVVDDQMYLNPEFFDQLLQSQQQSEVIFNKISVQTLTLFTNYDPNFSSDFISLLINDSCHIGKNDLSEVEFEKCKKNFKFNFLQNGVTMAMNYFTRKVRQTIIEVKNFVIRQLAAGKSAESIKQHWVQRFKKDEEFKEIDQSIFYMFKLYQATQSKIYASLETTIVSTMDVCFFFVMMEIVVIGFVYPLSLFINYKQKKYELSKLYVSFLLIPSPVSQFIKTFSQKVQQILQYN